MGQICPIKDKEMLQQQSSQEAQDAYNQILRTCLKGYSRDKQHELNIDASSEFYPQQLHLQQRPSSNPSQADFSNEDCNIFSERIKKNPSYIVSCKQGDEEICLEDGTTYHGETNRGIPCGKGEVSYPCGDYYKGQFLKGVKHGRGVYIFHNGDEYDGDFANDLMDGRGIFKFENGDVYQGQFKKNNQHGFGKYTPKFPNQHRIICFEGDYENGLKHGPGVMKYEDREFQGNWKQGKYSLSLRK